MTASNRSTLFWGALLIIVGLVWLLNNFNLVPGSVGDWWPLGAIAAGIWLLAQGFTQRHGGVVGGTVLLGLGLYWLLLNLGRINNDLFLPVLFISLGVGLLLRAFVRGR